MGSKESKKAGGEFEKGWERGSRTERVKLKTGNDIFAPFLPAGPRSIFPLTLRAPLSLGARH